MRANTTRRNNRYLVFKPQFAQYRKGFRDDNFKIEPGIVKIADRRCTQVAPGITRMLDDNGGRQPVRPCPFFKNNFDAAGIRQNRNQCDIRVIGCQVGEIQRQTRADDQCFSTLLEGSGDVILIG